MDNSCKNLLELLENRSITEPNRIAYTFINYENDKKNEINLTYKDVYNKARSIAVMLKKQGLKKGDRVIIFSSQTFDNIYSVYGTIFAGGIFTIIPPPIDESKKQRFKSVFESSKAKFILCNTMISERLEEVIYPKNIPKSISKMIAKRFKDISILDVEKCNESPEKCIKPEIDENSVAYLQYSSGSTNTPKGVMVSHKNVIYQLEEIYNSINGEVHNTYVAWVPFFHNMGLIGLIFLNVFSNARSVIMSPVAFVEKPIRWFKAISEYKGEITIAPNSAYDFCARTLKDDELDGVDLSSLKYAINGSEPIKMTTIESFSDKFGKFGFSKSAFTPGYGLAEAVCVVTSNGNVNDHKIVDLDKIKENKFVISEGKDDKKKTMVGNGKVLPGINVVFVNPETGKKCKEDEICEIWVQGPTVAQGYWDMDEETEKIFKAKLENYDGEFLKTGDLGLIHEGVLYITGRLKELMIINGHNVYSHDIEANVKEGIPALRNCEVISFSTLINSNESIITVVEVPEGLKFGYSEISKSIINVISKIFELSPYDIIFIKRGTIPMTDNNKIQISKAKILYEDGKLNALYSSKSNTNNKKSDKVVVKPKNKYEEKVLNIFTKLLNTYDVSVEDNFFALGGDSLTIPQVVKDLEEEFKIVFPIKFFLEEPTVSGISKFVELIDSDSEIKILEKTKEFFYSETDLDESIKPSKYEDENTFEYKNVFLTGSTGFVGAHLIRDLIEMTDSKVYCHVRARDEGSAWKRIIDNMKFYKCWEDKYFDRIQPVLGDLSKPKLGIESSLYEKLTKIVDAVYHNGALLNFIYPYSYLKDINVYGTIEMLKFACENKPKYFHHISTYSVYDNPSHFEKMVLENDPLESPEGYFLGYSESKWVAEKLVKKAEKRGLRVSIYRPGEITGASEQGIWKMNDLVSRYIVSAIQMGVMPKIPLKVHMTPVDYVSKAIVALSIKKEMIGKEFNVLTEQALTLFDIKEYINSYGYKVELVPYEDWKYLLSESNESNPLKLLQPLFFEEARNERESIIRRYTDLQAEFDVSNTLNGLEKTEIECIKVTKDIMSKYLDNFVNNGYLEAPKIIHAGK